MRFATFTAVTAISTLLLAGCGGSSGSSSSTPATGTMNFRALWRQPGTTSQAVRRQVGEEIEAGGFGTPIPAAVRTGRVIFSSDDGTRCCVAFDPRAEIFAERRLLVLTNLPAGPATVWLHGFATNFAPTGGIATRCETNPTEAGFSCSSNPTSPSFDSAPQPVTVVAGQRADAGTILVDSLPFVIEETLMPARGAAVQSPINVRFTVADATSGINGESIGVRLFPEDLGAIVFEPGLVPCADGSSTPCSAGGLLNVSGFQVSTESITFPQGNAQVRIDAANSAGRLLSLAYDIEVLSAEDTATPTETVTALPTVTATTSATPSVTITPTATSSSTATATASPSVTVSPTASSRPTSSPSATPSSSPTSTPSLTPTSTRTVSPSPTVPVHSPTPTETPSNTPTDTATPISTETMTRTVTNTTTVTSSPTATSTSTHTSTPSVTETATEIATGTSSPTSSPTVTSTPTITSTSTTTFTPSPTNTPEIADRILSGTVVDCLTGLPIQFARVSLITPVLREQTVGSDGRFQFTELFPGTYIVQGATSGFNLTQIQVVLDVPQRDVTLSLCPVDTNALRVVMTWGAMAPAPADLDSHLRGPAPGSFVAGVPIEFHTFFAIPMIPVPIGGPVMLDIDDTDFTGPETVSVPVLESGEYRYCVHDYTNAAILGSTALGTSSARVQAFLNGQQIGDFTVPQGTGTVWEVFKLDTTVSPSVIIPVNVLSDESNETQVCRRVEDTDGDGLTIEQEQFLQTNPALYDTNGNQLPDGLDAILAGLGGTAFQPAQSPSTVKPGRGASR